MTTAGPLGNDHECPSWQRGTPFGLTYAQIVDVFVGHSLEISDLLHGLGSVERLV